MSQWHILRIATMIAVDVMMQRLQRAQLAK